MQRPTENKPIVHLRTGEPGAGATLHTIHEISRLHPEKTILYGNINFVKLANWKKIELSAQGGLNHLAEAQSKETVLFVDDFTCALNIGGLEKLLKIIEQQGIITYLVDGRLSKVNKEISNRAERLLSEHVHYKVLNNEASIRTSLAKEHEQELIAERSLRNPAEQMIIEFQVLFDKSLFGKYSSKPSI